MKFLLPAGCMYHNRPPFVPSLQSFGMYHVGIVIQMWGLGLVLLYIMHEHEYHKVRQDIVSWWLLMFAIMDDN